MSSLNKIYSIKIACLAVMLLALLASAPLALAQNGTRLSLKPVEEADGLITVEVLAENVTDLYGLELHLKYDPAMLEIQDSQAEQPGVQIEAGTLLPVSQGFVVANQADQAQGTIVYALTLLNPAPAVSGSGPVARMSFKVLQNSPSIINMEQSTLVSVNLETIQAEASPLTVGGSGEAGSAGGGSNTFPWWIVAAVVLGLGVLAMSGFVIMSGFNKKTQPQIAEGPARGSGRRPSAFKDSL